MPKGKIGWYQDSAELARRTRIYHQRVIEGIPGRELAEIYGYKQVTMNQMIRRYYQWLKNGCPTDITQREMIQYKRPNHVLQIGYWDIDSLKACEFAHKASRKGYSAEKIRDGLATVGMDMTVPAIKEMTRKCRNAEYELGKPLDFRILRDDLLKVGIEGYGREYYFE